VSLKDVGEFRGRKLYTELKLDYILRRWAPTPASRAISAVAELLVLMMLQWHQLRQCHDCCHHSSGLS